MCVPSWILHCCNIWKWSPWTSHRCKGFLCTLSTKLSIRWCKLTPLYSLPEQKEIILESFWFLVLFFWPCHLLVFATGWTNNPIDFKKCFTKVKNIRGYQNLQLSSSFIGFMWFVTRKLYYCTLTPCQKNGHRLCSHFNQNIWTTALEYSMKLETFALKLCKTCFLGKTN